MSDRIIPTDEQIKKAAENQRLYGAFNPFQGASLESPIALTEDHIPSLERAIRAEGYDIKVDTETGEVKLYRRACVCDKGGLGDLCDGDCRLD